MEKYLKTSDPEFKKVFSFYWNGKGKLPSIEGFPEGLDLENLDINDIKEDSIQLVGGGDWQESIPFSFAVKASNKKPVIVDLYDSSYTKTKAKDIREYMDSLKEGVYSSHLDPLPGEKVNIVSTEMAPPDKHGVNILAGNDEYDDDMLPEYDFTGSYRNRRPYGESLEEGAKVGKLKHLTHLEDLIITDGLNGAQYAQDIIESLNEMLQGQTPKKDLRITTKLDGCVAKDTLIETDQGFMPIGEVIRKIQTGALISSVGLDLDTKNKVETPLHVFDVAMGRGEKPWISLTLEDGTILKCTTDHPVYTKNRGYVKAKDLTEDDDIYFEEG